MFIGYFATCTMYSLACFEAECKEDGWFMSIVKVFVERGVSFDAIFHPSVESMYYTLSIMLCSKHSSVREHLTHEKIIKHLFILLAHCLFSLFFAEICAAMVLSVEEQRHYREYIDNMKVFLKRCNIDSNLMKQVASVIEFQWTYKRNVKISGKSDKMGNKRLI